jgi:hypothetical protein
VAVQDVPVVALQVTVTPVAVVAVVEVAVIETDRALRSGTAIGTPPAISVRVPLGLPAPVGAKTTVIAHCAAAPSAAPQLLV